MKLRALFVALGTLAGVLVVATPAQAAPATAVFTKTSEWGSAFEGKYVITNGTTSTINGWSVAFDLPSGGNVTSQWDAVLSRSGQRFTLSNVGWNGTLAPGASASFGFIASPGSAVPANCTLNGQPCGGGTTNPGAPGTPGTPSVTGSTSSSISLSWGASSGTVVGYRVYEGSTQRAQVTGTSATISGIAACTSKTYTVRAYNSVGESSSSGPVTGSTTGCPTGGRADARRALPLHGLGRSAQPRDRDVRVGREVLHDGLHPVERRLQPGLGRQPPAQQRGRRQRHQRDQGAGGSIQVSFGGWSGNKLGPNCSTPQAYAQAVQTVINATGPAVVDFDIENTDEFENYTVQDRILNGLKIVKQNNPNIKIAVTFRTSTSGPTAAGVRLISQARALAVPIDNFTIMTFDFGSSNIQQDTINASEGLKNVLKSAYGYTRRPGLREDGHLRHGRPVRPARRPPPRRPGRPSRLGPPARPHPLRDVVGQPRPPPARAEAWSPTAPASASRTGEFTRITGGFQPESAAEEL